MPRGYKHVWFQRVIVNGHDVDISIDRKARVVRLRRGMTMATAFAAGVLFGQVCAADARVVKTSRASSRPGAARVPRAAQAA
jgi:hypothetical protein